MFDIGWQELFIVGLVTIIVVGPKELPRVLRTVTLWIRKIRGMARDFQDGLEELAREADLDDMKRELEVSTDFDLEAEVERTIDPGGDVEAAVRELGDAVDEGSGPDATAGGDAAEPKPAAGKAGDAA